MKVFCTEEVKEMMQGSFCISVRPGNKWHNKLAVLVRWNKKRNTDTR